MSIKVKLDPGHKRGVNKGTCYYEGDNNWAYAQVLKAELEKAGFEVSLTKTSVDHDPTLEARGESAEGCDLFLSLHSDALGSSTARGVTILDDVNPKYANTTLATKLGQGIAKALGTNFRGVRYRYLSSGVMASAPKVGESNYYGVLRSSYAKHNMLIEHGFHTNPDDCNAFKTRHREVAQATADILAAHYKTHASPVEPIKEYTAQEFIDILAPMAIADWKKSGILPSVTIAQGMVESANGNSELARKANNLFGIKSSPPWTGEKYTKTTSEFVNGKYIKVDADFRKYKSWQESVDDHGAFFRSTPARVSLYKHVYTATTWQAAVNALTGTYATSPTYAQTLTDRITRYGLDKYDRKPQHMDKPYYGVFALNKADQPLVDKIIHEVRGAVRYNRSITPEEMFDAVIQVGGAKLRDKYVHLAGSNREETAKAVTAWLEERSKG